MADRPDVVALTRALVSLDTVNPPGNEGPAMDVCVGHLERAGFACGRVDGPDGLAGVVATRGTGSGPALAFTGHLDTVPLGAADWSVDPFSAEIADGRMYGRGTTDMKGGVAAMICACIASEDPPGGLALFLTTGEETGADGARAMEAAGLTDQVGALIVGEPTGNRLMAGHKGALWLRLTFHGQTAHGASPGDGVNAITAAAQAALALDALPLGPAHAILGPPTLNIATITGGLNINSVPDRCEMTLDLRSVPGMNHNDLVAAISAEVGSHTQIARIVDLSALWSDPESGWMTHAANIVARITGATSGPGGVSYFTDASILTPALGTPATAILGPGDIDQAHRTDESLSLDRLHEAVDIYAAMIAAWRGDEGPFTA